MTLELVPTFLVISLAVTLPTTAAQTVAARPPRSMERILKIGTPTVLEVESPVPPYKVVFEDDGETGYFYALDLSQPPDSQILDAMNIYDVAHMANRPQRRTIRVQWSRDGQRAALLLNDQPQAVFDFAGKRGYARSNFPATSRWSAAGHAWSASAMVGFDK